MLQQPSAETLFVLDISLKSLLLCGLAAVILRVFRLRDAGRQHQIWSGVVVVMLLLPVLTLLIPSIAVPLPVDFAAADASITSTGTTPEASSTDAGGERDAATASSTSLGEAANTAAPGHQHIAAHEKHVAESFASPSSGVAAAAPWTMDVPDTCFTVWLVVATVFTIRLATGLWSSSRLRLRAHVIDDESIRKCLDGLPDRSAWTFVSIRQSAEVLVPVTIGWFRPAVLLPTDWKTWSPEKLTAVLTHEFTHVIRRDFPVNILAEWNRCLFWFHPVAWWLRRHLSDLAEEACDDAAIARSGNAPGYARHLLEIAATIGRGNGRRIRLGLSMARRSKVESRITAILDSSRPLSQPMSSRTKVLVAFTALPLIVFATALTPVPTAPAAAQESISQSPSFVTDASLNDTVRIRGQVTDDQGNPIPESRVRLFRVQRPVWHARADTSTLIDELPVDSAGRFDRMVSRTSLPKELLYSDAAVLVVSAPNYAYVAFAGNPDPDAEPSVDSPNFMRDRLNVTLTPQVPVQGRVLSSDGQPVAGAEISLHKRFRFETESLDEWIKKASGTPLPDKDGINGWGGGPARNKPKDLETRRFPVQMAPVVVTDDQGAFEMPGIGADDGLILRIRGEGIVDRLIHVVGRDTPTIYAQHLSNLSSAGPWYGRNFRLSAEPSIPVEGVVRDIDTRTPLRDITVTVSTLYNSRWSHLGYITTKTDSNGRYRISGLPLAPEGTRRGNRLAVFPGTLPYIETEWIPVPTGTSNNPLEFNIEMRRAVTAHGRLTDQTTGKPIQAELWYAPFRTNDYVGLYMRFADDVTTMLGNDTRVRTDEDGRFRIPVIPGRGVLAAKCEGGTYIPGFGLSAITELQPEPGKQSADATSDHFIPSMFHSLKAIDVPEGSSEFEVSMHVDAGFTATLHCVDPHDRPLTDVTAQGLRTDRRSVQITNADQTIHGLAVDAIRPIYVHNENRTLGRLLRFVPSPGESALTVKLLPCTQITGRVVRPDGVPLADISLEARHDNDPEATGMMPRVRTDEDGRFEYRLVTGARYQVVGFADRYFYVAKDLDVETPQHIDLGELTVDPNGERWSPAIPRRDPIISDLPVSSDTR